MARRRSTTTTTRDAGLGLLLCVATILVVCVAVLESGAWKEARADGAEPYYSQLPDVEFSSIPEAKADAILRRLNLQRCPCDCMRTIASCRNHHRSCTMSIAAARAAIAAAR